MKKIFKENKYKNKKQPRVIGGKIVWFDSIKEAERYDDLYLLEKAKKISNLEIQPEFELIPTFDYRGKTMRGVKYIADFKYNIGNKTVVEDVKSEFTAKDKTYRVKIKLFLLMYGKDIDFKEV
jgi:hypothetical protein